MPPKMHFKLLAKINILFASKQGGSSAVATFSSEKQMGSCLGIAVYFKQSKSTAYPNEFCWRMICFELLALPADVAVIKPAVFTYRRKR